MRSSSLIQALLLWRCLQRRNAQLYSVLFGVAPCFWKSLCKIPRAQNSWGYESIVVTDRITGKRMNIKKIKLLLHIQSVKFHHKAYMPVVNVLSMALPFHSIPSCVESSSCSRHHDTWFSPKLRQVAHYQYVESGRNVGDDFRRFLENHRVKCRADDAFRRFRKTTDWSLYLS